MANVIIPKRSTTAAAVPSAGSLQTGEIAINLTDKKLFVKDGSGNVVSLTTDVAPIYARVEKNAGQSFSSGVTTTVTYQNVIEDASSLWDSVNNQYVVPAVANGKIAVISVEHQDSADGTTVSELFIERSQNSGSSWSRVAQSPNGGLDHFGILSATAILKVSTGDWFRVRRIANEAKTSASDLRCSFSFCTLNAVKGDTGATGPAASPSGATGSIQYNDGGAFGGAANVNIDGGDLLLDLNSSPTTPAANTVKLFATRTGGRVVPGIVDNFGKPIPLQAALAKSKPGQYLAIPAATAPSQNGFPLGTATGGTSRTVSPTNIVTRWRRHGYVSSATAGNFGQVFASAVFGHCGNGSGLGGFLFATRFAMTDAATVSGARAFVGVSSSTSAATNVEPSTLTNAVGIAQLSTDATQLFLCYGGSAAQTAIGLGTGFPPMSGTTPIPYDLYIYSPPNANGVFYIRLERLDTNTVYENTLTPGTPGTQTPSNTTGLAPRWWRCNNATALAVGIDVATSSWEDI